MKELEIRTQSDIEIREEEQQKKEVKMIGQQRKIPGLTLFEFNKKTGAIKPATYKKQSIEINSLVPKKNAVAFHHKVEINEECFYIQALNSKSAIKKLKKIFS